jgi:Fe-S cluster assembly protein SufD
MSMATVTPIRTPVETALIHRFEAEASRRPGGPLRAAGIEAFRASGLPHRRIEAWHYTDLRSLMREAAPAAPRPDSAALARARAMLALLPAIEAHRVVLVDGWRAPELDDAGGPPAGVRLSSLAEALDRDDPLIGKLGRPVPIEGNAAIFLNTAFMTDGALIEVEAGAVVDRPIHLVHLVTGAVASAVAVRSLALVGKGARFALVESVHGAPAGHQINDMLEVAIGSEATFDHLRIDVSGRQTLSLSTLAMAIGAEAKASTFNVQIGGGVVRRQPFMRFGGENARLDVGAINLLGGEQTVDLTLTVEHPTPHCASRELVRSVVDDRATGTFQGKIIVRSEAQKTDGQMASNALLLSDDATMNNKPELEIFADDVVCAHGATCGALPADQLFYLMARGLSKADAEALLIEAFVGEAIDALPIEAAQDPVRGIVRRWLAARGEGQGAGI